MLIKGLVVGGEEGDVLLVGWLVDDGWLVDLRPVFSGVISNVQASSVA